MNVKFLDLQPTVGFNVPTLQRVTTGGNLPAGTYKICYRYKSESGSTTNWSPLSNKVAIYESEEHEPYCDIEGNLIDTGDPNAIELELVGENTGKRIECQELF